MRISVPTQGASNRLSCDRCPERVCRTPLAAFVFGLVLVASLSSCSRPDDVEVRDITICRSPQPLAQADSGSFRVAAKVTNNGKSILVLPVFRVQVKDRPKIKANCVAGFFLPPGASGFLVTGGIYFRVDEMGDASEADVKYLYSELHMPPEYVDYQLKNLPLLSLKTTSTTFHASNNSCAVEAQFENRTGKAIALVEGSAIFLDANDKVVDAYPFDFAPTESGVVKLWLFAVPGAAKAQRCILQIGHFREEGKSVPESVPPPPSVR